MISAINIQNLIINKIDSEHFVSGQIAISMMKEISALGIKLIINNRPEGESYDQPSNKELEKHAKLFSIIFKTVPFSGNDLTREKISNLSTILKDNDGPVLLYCKSGIRSANIWALSNILDFKKDISKIENILNTAGYDTSVLSNMVEYFGQ